MQQHEIPGKKKRANSLLQWEQYKRDERNEGRRPGEQITGDEEMVGTVGHLTPSMPSRCINIIPYTKTDGQKEDFRS